MLWIRGPVQTIRPGGRRRRGHDRLGRGATVLHRPGRARGRFVQGSRRPARRLASPRTDFRRRAADDLGRASRGLDAQGRGARARLPRPLGSRVARPRRARPLLAVGAKRPHRHFGQPCRRPVAGVPDDPGVPGRSSARARSIPAPLDAEPAPRSGAGRAIAGAPERTRLPPGRLARHLPGRNPHQLRAPPQGSGLARSA